MYGFIPSFPTKGHPGLLRFNKLHSRIPRSFTSNICELKGSKSRNQGSKTALRNNQPQRRKLAAETCSEIRLKPNLSSGKFRIYEFTISWSPKSLGRWIGLMMFPLWWCFLEILWMNMSFSEKSVLFSTFKTTTNIYDLLVATQTSCTKSKIFENSELYLNKGTSGSY